MTKIKVLILIIIAALIGLGFWFVSNKNAPQETSQPTTEAPPVIQDTSDLDSTSEDLDTTDLDGIDSELNQINSDASSF
ncbi:hypothetical protein A2361_00330 [Candidatus Woesebacteria bacterium RIFOXYB1_FULL_40_26]|uniref:Uncharacterized protein n=2 Tax=Candidatus Woeseibacteriota TaxID=1752722 RepID=A0A1F8DIU1_9BACT|nr:MAG: hypothetical protein A2361_00330 [Candidatus Woesebacteria bacterium RIFOXYB1_FULL_40_26]OGM88530.1 MAG: hypothetical protein A2614_00970 [Candidatus Woesebacteria bacterium RIFOXYD1_FULL_40_21]